MAVCVAALLILAKNVSAFGWLGEDEPVEWAGLVMIGWVQLEVRYWPGCWVRMMFVVKVGVRASDIVAGMERASVA